MENTPLNFLEKLISNKVRVFFMKTNSIVAVAIAVTIVACSGLVAADMTNPGGNNTTMNQTNVTTPENSTTSNETASTADNSTAGSTTINSQENQNTEKTNTATTPKTVASQEPQGTGCTKVTYSDGSVCYVYTSNAKYKSSQEYYNSLHGNQTNGH